MDKNISWINVNAINTYNEHTKNTTCGANRCIHFTHINQSDQMLSFPRTKWIPKTGYVTKHGTILFARGNARASND